jgi:hypothetical protein
LPARSNQPSPLKAEASTTACRPPGGRATSHQVSTGLSTVVFIHTIRRARELVGGGVARRAALTI